MENSSRSKLATPFQETLRQVAGALLVLADYASEGEAAPDELVAFPFGLERAAARDLVRKDQIPSAKIGRKTYARRSDVLALVDRLGSEQVARRKSVESETPRQTYMRLAGARP